jgi:transposase-like protein
MDTQKKEIKEILEQKGFKCEKCEYYSPLGQGLELNKELNAVLCSVCNTFAPFEKEKLQKYINEKVNWQILETFRNSGTNKASHSVHKQGMIEKSKQGFLVARPPFGYKVENGQPIIDNENSENVRLIFNEFANGKSLNQIAGTYGISVNGIKKILKNFTYLGKIKFNSQIIQGKHPALISPELFNRVQSRFESLNKDKTN